MPGSPLVSSGGTTRGRRAVPSDPPHFDSQRLERLNRRIARARVGDQDLDLVGAAKPIRGDRPELTVVGDYDPLPGLLHHDPVNIRFSAGRAGEPFFRI